MAVVPAGVSRGATAFWADGPEVDAWVYPNAGFDPISGDGPGTRNRAPTFNGAFVDPETATFVRSGYGDSSRLGMGVFGFETMDQVETGLDPSRYAIESASVTVWANKAGPPGSSIIYTDQPKTPADLLAEALAGGIGAGQPMELFGVGFRASYDGFALGTETDGDRFSEMSDPYDNGEYNVYPVVGDGVGGYVDASNSYTGGFSATDPSGETDPFTATPWSIGTLDATPGDPLSGIMTFTFDLDLTQPGVVAYLQQSLSEGVVGFMLSSMHPAGQEGEGGLAYPDWRTREGASGIAFPTLAIEYDLLATPGDYNGDGDVDGDDYTVWSQAYGSAVDPGAGADGNGDGVVNAADYTVWRDAAAAASTSITVPEPSAGVYALTLMATIGFCAGTVGFTAPRRNREE